jgi:hypothetical protein
MRRPLVTSVAPQHGHRGKVLTSSRIRRTRIVAIEFGMWRSGREASTFCRAGWAHGYMMTVIY